MDPPRHLLGEVADIYVETGQFDEGLKFFFQLEKHFPRTAAISLRIGQIHYYKAEYRQALASLAPIEESVSHGGQALSLKARILLRTGRIKEAVMAYTSAEKVLNEAFRAYDFW